MSFLFIKKLWAKLFRREVKYSTKDQVIAILKNAIVHAEKGNLNIYNGTLNGLRSAQANNSSVVFIIEIILPPPRTEMIKFNEYIAKLKEAIRG